MNGIRILELKLTVNSIGSIQWYIDASYAVYNDCKGNTRGVMTMGGGAITIFSRKQKINAKSSPEADLIGLDDALPQILWTQCFI